MLKPENEFESLAQAIAQCMPCHLCPNKCNAQENSSMANCVIQWIKTLTNAVKQSY